MKKLLISIIILCVFVSVTTAQSTDTLIYERFETGGTSFSLNTGSLGGAIGTAGYNQWIINNAYTGGNGVLVCIGFPFNFTIPNTALQPAAQTGGTSTNYMHIVSDAGQASGIQNCCFQAADGICGVDESNFSAMSQDVVTTGYDSVTVSFLWICNGGTNIYGELYYSTDGGLNWIVMTTPFNQYRNQSNWTQQSISIPQFAGQTSLRFGYRFVNSSSTAATEPGFGIDEFLITASTSVPPVPVAAAFSVSDTVICENECIDFTDLSSGNPVTYLWIFQGATTSFSTAQNPSQICYNVPGTYEVTLIVTGATGSDTLTFNSIVVNPEPAAPDITFMADTLYATQGFSTYQWSLNAVIIPGANADFTPVLTDGLYSVAVTDSNGCSATGSINYVTGLTAYAGQEVLNVYPNPSNSSFHINNVEQFSSLTVINSIGKTILKITADISNELNLRDYPEGIYFLIAESKNGNSYYMKLIKM